MDKFTKRVLTLVLSLFLIAYVAYQTVRSLHEPIKTEIVQIYQMHETVDAKVVAVREEFVLESENSGYLYSAVKNGERVAKDGVVATWFNNENDAQTSFIISEIDKQLGHIESIEKQGNTAMELDTISKNIWDEMFSMEKKKNKAYFEDLNDNYYALFSYFSKQNAIVSDKPDFAALKASLQNEKTSLQSSFSGTTTDVISPVSGHYVSKLDGYEEIFTKDNIMDLDIKKFNELLKQRKEVQQNSSGKVIQGFMWNLVCTLSKDDVGILNVDATYNIVFPLVSEERVPATIIKMNTDEEGDTLVVFKCEYIAEEIADIREEDAQIHLYSEPHSGLRIPANRVVYNDENKAGVYVLSGNIVKFKLIDIVYANREFVISKQSEEKDYLKLYDDVIVEGSELYDGKSISI